MTIFTLIALSTTMTLMLVSSSQAVEPEYFRNMPAIYGRGDVSLGQRQPQLETPRVRRQGGHEGVTGPVHTYVKTDEHAHFKWGVRHNVGHHYAGRR